MIGIESEAVDSSSQLLLSHEISSVSSAVVDSVVESVSMEEFDDALGLKFFKYFLSCFFPFLLKA